MGLLHQLNGICRVHAVCHGSVDGWRGVNPDYGSDNAVRKQQTFILWDFLCGILSKDEGKTIYDLFFNR